MASNIQYKEREGEVWSRNAERDKTATLLGMSAAETAAFREQAHAAEQAKWDAISGGLQSLGDMFSTPPAQPCVTCQPEFGQEDPEPPEPEYPPPYQVASCPGLV